MKRLFKISKWLHKYLGLLLIVFLIWMSFSGILLNHPDWFGSWMVPNALVPPPYRVHDWNQGALRDALVLEDDQVLFAGLKGVWKSVDGGNSFQVDQDGLDSRFIYRKTNDLHFDKASGLIFASTDGGLFRRPTQASTWRRCELKGSKNEKVKKVLSTPRGLVAVTDSNIYHQEGDTFSIVQVGRPNSGVELIKLCFDIHDGKVWGLPGRLIMDVTALILAFLSLSALIIWLFPKLQESSRGAWYRWLKRAFKFCFQKHLKWSIWFGAPLLILGLTGMFMRPPMLVFLAEKSVPNYLYPGPLPNNPWYKKIKNATYLPHSNEIIIEADGFWKAEFAKKTSATPLDWQESPIHVMGTTVLEPIGEETFLLGSFSGLLTYRTDTQTATDYLTGEPAMNRSRIRSHEYRVTGYFQTDQGLEFAASHHKGLSVLTSDGPSPDTVTFKMPDAVNQTPLWDYMFELHNGRIFSHWIGAWSKLLVPLASILYVILSLSGFFDWYIITIFKKRKRRA